MYKQYVHFVYVSMYACDGRVCVIMYVCDCVFPYMYSLLASLALIALGTLMRGDL